jgi:hypothetical protein
LFFALTSAPALSSIFTTSASHFWAASISGVLPRSSAAFAFAPRAMSSFTMALVSADVGRTAG